MDGMGGDCTRSTSTTRQRRSSSGAHPTRRLVTTTRRKGCAYRFSPGTGRDRGARLPRSWSLMARLTVSFLGAADRDTLHEQTLTVLEEVGVAYNTPAAMDVLEGTGAVLDRERLTACLPRELVERCLETAPRTAAARRPRPRPRRVARRRQPELHERRRGHLHARRRERRAARGQRRRPAHDHAPLRRPARRRLRMADDLGPRPRPADRQPRDRGDLVPFLRQTRADRGAPARVRRPAARDDRRRGRGAGGRAAGLLDDQLHRRAARPRRPHDRSEHRPGPRRRADRHPAAAADGHHGADHGGRSDRRRAGRAALGGGALPARGARLPADRLAGAGLRRPAQRALRVHLARGRGGGARRRGDGQAGLRPADAGPRSRQ